MKLIRQITNEENNFLTEFKNEYSEEIDIALNIARILLNKDKQVDIILDNFTIIEDKVTIEVWIVGYTSEQNVIIPNDVIDLMKTIELTIQTDNTINRLDSKTIMTFNIDKIKEYKQDIILLKTCLKLFDLYMDMNLTDINPGRKIY